MSSVDWKRGFFATPRGRILLLLRRARRTIKELAEAMDLTENAVRSHLARLQHQDLIEQGVRRSRVAGKPAFEYRLTPLAESMFPRAHSTVLDSLLADMEDTMSLADYQEQLREVGQRLAGRYTVSSNGLRTQLQEAAAILETMGGVIEIEEKNGTYLICGYSCPLFGMTQVHPQVCKLIEAMLASMLKAPVREQCERGETLSCRFEVTEV
jgi:predicted ArsR family transcriptional regulator